MRIFCYIHAWHHAQNIELIIREVERRGVRYRILTFVPRDDNAPRVAQLFPRVEVFAESRAFQTGEKLNQFGRPGKVLGLLWLFLWVLIYLAWQRPARLVVSEDVTLWSGVLVRAARLCRITTIHLPAENIHFVDGWLYERHRQGKIVATHPRVLQRLAHWLYPVNIQPHEGKLVYWYAPGRILGSYLLGLLPKTPWVRGSNHIDRVAVNSRVQFDENTRYGLDAARQTITGFPMHDQLAACLRDRTAIKTRILAHLEASSPPLHCMERGQGGEDKICLIVGTAPRYLWSEADLPAAYAAHSNLLRTLRQTLGDDCHILFKIHPREDREAFIERIGDSHGAFFLKTEFSVYELLAASDVVIMFLSSTVIAAFALDVPVLAYGIHSLPGMHDFYDRYPSIDQVYSLGEIRDLLANMDDPAYLADLQRRRTQDRAHYGMFDGDNTRRLVELILK